MGKSFKGFSKALSLILALAMVVTCVPTSAYAAELLSVDESEDLLISNDALVEESSEESSSTSIDTQKEADLAAAPEENTAGEEEIGPDQANNDIKVSFANGGNANLSLYTKNGDDYSAFGVTEYATSDYDYTVYLKAETGFKLDSTKTEPLTLGWYDYTAKEKHEDGVADPGTAKNTKKPADGYTVGSLNADGYYPITITSALLKDTVIEAMYLKDKSWAQDGSQQRIDCTLSITLAASLEIADSFDVTITTAGSKYELNSLLPSAKKATYGSDYTIVLSGDAGAIKGGDKDTLNGGITREEITIEEVKISDGKVAKSIPVVRANKAATNLLPGMKYIPDSTDPSTYVEGTAKAILGGHDSFVSAGSDVYTGVTTPDHKTLYIGKAVINEVYENDDLTLRITLGKEDAPEATTHTITARDTEFIDYTLDDSTMTVDATDSSKGTFIAKDQTGSKDIKFAAAVKKAADKQTGDGTSARILGDITYSIAGAEAVKLTGSSPYTIAETNLTGNIVVSGTTLESIYDGSSASNHTLYDTDGAAITPGTGKIKTGDSYSFSVRAKSGYALASSDAVGYRLGNETETHYLTATDGVYTVSNVNNTLSLYVNTVVVGQKWSVKTSETVANYTATSESGSSGDITYSAANLATNDQVFFFTVKPDSNYSIASVQYTMEDAQGTASALTDAVKVSTAADGTITYKTATKATGAIVLTIKTAGVVEVYAPTNKNVTMYAVIDGKDVEMSATVATVISKASDFYFKVKPNTAKTKIVTPATDVTYYIRGTRDDSTAATAAPINATSGLGAIAKGDLTSVSNPIWFKAATVTEKTLGTDFVAYFNSTAKNPSSDTTFKIKDATSTDKKELTGQSLTIAQSEDMTIAVDIYVGKTKVVMDGNDTPAVDATKMGTALATIASTEFKVEKTETGSKVAEITSPAGKLTTTNGLTGDNYKEFNTGSDNVVATITATADATFDSAKYVATLPVTVVDHFSDFQVKVNPAKNSADDATALEAVAIGGTQDPFWTVQGKHGRTEKWVNIRSLTGIDCISSITWESDPDQTGLVSPLFVFADEADNMKTIDANAGTTKIAEPMEVTATATIKQRGNVTTDAVKSAKVKFVEKNNGYVVVPVVQINGGKEYFGTAAVANSDAGIPLQKGTTLNAATVTYRVFAYAATVADGAKAGIASALTSEAAVTKAVETDKTIKEVTAVFANDTAIINGQGADTSVFAKYADTDAHYSKVYVTPSGSAGSYTITAAEKTGTDTSNVYAEFAPTATVNSLAVTLPPVFFTVANSFPTKDVSFTLTDVKTTDKVGSKTITRVQKLADTYMNGYNRAALEDADGLEIGQVIKGVTVGSKINLPTASDLSTTTGSNRVLAGFSISGDYYAPGDEYTIPDGATAVAFTAEWTDKYVFEGLYNKNYYEKDEKGVETYGTAIAGWTGTAAATTPDLSVGGEIPMIAKVRTATILLSNKAKANDTDGKYAALSAGDIIYTDEYTQSNVSVAYDAAATDDDKAALTIDNLKIKGVIVKNSVPLIATLTVGTDKYLMQTAANAFNGVMSVNVATAANYVITKPADQKFYVGQDPADTVLNNLSITKNGKNHLLSKTDIIVTSDNESVVKAEVGTVVAASKVAQLKFTPVSAGKANVTVSVKDSQGVQSAESATFSVEVVDEGISLVFYAKDGTTKINGFETKVNSSTGEFIVRAEKNGVVQQTGSWAFTNDGTVITGSAGAIEEGFGRKVTVTSAAGKFSNEGKVTAKYTSGTVTYAKEIAVKTYYEVTFGTLGAGQAKEILVNGTVYKTGDPAAEANYPVKVFVDDKNSDGEYEVSVDSVTATYQPTGAGESKTFEGWKNADGGLSTSTKTGKAVFTAAELATAEVIEAQFADSDITFDGLSDGQVIVLTDESKTTTFKQFDLRVEPYNSGKQIKVTPKTAGFYTIKKGKQTGDYTVAPATAAASAAITLDINNGNPITNNNRTDSFVVGMATNAAGSTEVEVAAGDNKKTFTLVATGANFSGGTTVADITKYVDYDSTKGAYNVTNDKRSVKIATVATDVYFDKDGKPVKEGVATLSNGDGKTYLIKNYALMYGNKGGSIVTVGDYDYFADENGIATVAQLVKVDGKQYYFNSYGQKVTYAMSKEGKYEDPETKIVYNIDKATNEAEEDDRLEATTLTWSAWPNAKNITTKPEMKLTVKITSQKGKIVPDDVIDAVVEIKEKTEKKITYTATADVSKYYKKGSNYQEKLTTVTEEKSYPLDKSGKPTTPEQGGSTETEPSQPDDKANWNLFYTGFEMNLDLPSGAAPSKADPKAKWTQFYSVDETGTVTVKATGADNLKKAANATNSLIVIPVFDSDNKEIGDFEYSLPVFYAEPKLKLSSAKATYATKGEKEQTFTTTVLEEKSNKIFEPCELDQVPLWTASGKTNIKEIDLGTDTGAVTITTENAAKGKIKVQNENWAKAIEVSYNIAEGKNDVIEPSATVVNFNANTDKNEAKEISITLNGSDTFAEDAITAELPKKWDSNIELDGIEGGKVTSSTIKISVKDDTKPVAGNYTIKLSTANKGKANIKVAVAKNTLDKAVKLNVKAKMDLTTGQPMVIVPDLKAVNGEITAVEFDEASAALFDAEVNGLGQIVVTAKEADKVNAKTTYETTLTVTVSGVECPTALKFKPNATKPKVKIDKITLPASAFAADVEGTANVLATYKYNKKTFTIAPTKVEFDKATKNESDETISPNGLYKLTYDETTGTIKVEKNSTVAKAETVKVVLTFPGNIQVKATLNIKVDKKK